jgi:branched-chain amino acid transport system substrate-binding protein
VNQLAERFEKRWDARPATQYAFPIWAFMELWAKAVEKAGTTDAQAVVDVMNSYKDEPTLLGPRTFTPMLHIQDQPLELIAEVGGGQGKVIDQWRISEPVPQEVHYRLKTN